MIFDTSGSMSMPVYDPGINYAFFMKKMAEGGISVDENHCRNGLAWWDKDGTGSDYDRLSQDEIYLVSTWAESLTVSYTNSLGTIQHAYVISDILKNTGSETDPLENKRHPLLTGSIIPYSNAFSSSVFSSGSESK